MMTEEMEPLPTGVTGLDLLLHGGISQNAFVVLVGPTGAGKTVLASQLLFHAVSQGRTGLILTAYSEGHGKLLEHLSSMSYFDADAIGKTLTLLSLPQSIGGDLETATSAIIRSIRDSGAKIVLLDGFQGIANQLGGRVGVRQLLATIATQLTYLKVTLLVTLTGNARDEPTTTGLTSADMVLGLHYDLDGWRHIRRIEVLKQRGRGHATGSHTYRISDDGIAIFPRLETRPVRMLQDRPAGRMAFGLPELDTLLGGGPTAGSTTLLIGAPGVGKSTLGLVWALAADDAPGSSVFLNFEEQLSELEEKATMLGLPLWAAQESGSFIFLNLSPVELNPDEMADRLLTVLKPGVQRVVIDNMRIVEQTLGSRTTDFLAALLHHLTQAGVTTMLLLEMRPLVGLQVDMEAMPLSLLSDNTMIVQQVAAVGAIRRVLAVLKMRYSAHDSTLRELVIDGQGVRVLTPPQSHSGVLEAAADASGLIAPENGQE